MVQEAGGRGLFGLMAAAAQHCESSVPVGGVGGRVGVEGGEPGNHGALLTACKPRAVIPGNTRCCYIFSNYNKVFSLCS